MAMLSFITAWIQMPAAACEKIASDLGLGDVFFTKHYGLMHFLQFASQDLVKIWQKKCW